MGSFEWFLFSSDPFVFWEGWGAMLVNEDHVDDTDLPCNGFRFDSTGSSYVYCMFSCG